MACVGKNTRGVLPANPQILF